QLGVNLPVKSDQHIKIINSNVVSIAAGDNHSFAILDNGYLYSWGNNEFYQLGDGTTDNRNSPVCIIPEPGNP
ncbi:MAG TPA: hypothetical protein VKY57_10800, partial [Chitinispirillaceae bacterium]|nr:hypothetical protein [Chitinispirillaceae bacterium]